MPHSDQRSPRENRSAAGPILAVIVALLGFLPIANWIPGGRDVSWYGSAIAAWARALVVCAGVGALAAIASNHARWLWRDGAVDPVARRFDRRPVLGPVLVALAAFALYAATASLYSRRPIHIDELAQLFQARIFASGRLSLPVSPHPEFFSALHIVDAGGRVYSQFPAGGPAFLALGVLVGAPWIVNAVLAALAVLAFAAFVRAAEPTDGVRLGATLLFAFAPFTVFMSGSEMNHVPTQLCLLVGMASLVHLVTATRARPWLALLCGLGFGLAATVRPVDALAFALPAGAWLAWRVARAPRDRARWSELVASGVGIALPFAALMVVNARTTGAPLRFGYEVLWGRSHALGFHAAPWGMSHTPTRGLELVNLYALRLQIYFLEATLPSLLPAIVTLALTRRWSAIDRYLATSSALLVGVYFAYWHDGFFLGPRFMYPLVPVLALLTARALPLVRERLAARQWRGLALYRVVVYGAVASAVLAIAQQIPERASQYARGLASMRWDLDELALADGASHALVLVREPWGAQLVARMWALGISRPQAELLYHGVDACVLDERLDALERSGVRDSAAFAAIAPALRDSSRLVGSTLSPDSTERMLPELAYGARCERRIDEDRAGTTIYALTLDAHEHDNVYARDLHAADRWLLSRYPDRPVYLLAPTSAGPGARPRFSRVSIDSLERSWSSER